MGRAVFFRLPPGDAPVGTRQNCVANTSRRLCVGAPTQDVLRGLWPALGDARAACLPSSRPSCNAIRSFRAHRPCHARAARCRAGRMKVLQAVFMARHESSRSVVELLADVRACCACEAHLPLGPRPVLQAGAAARILVVGQAPGARVHASGIPWDGRSGARLRTRMHGWASMPLEDERIDVVHCQCIGGPGC